MPAFFAPICPSVAFVASQSVLFWLVSSFSRKALVAILDTYLTSGNFDLLFQLMIGLTFFLNGTPLKIV